MTSDILEIDADPAGVVLTLAYDGFGAPVTEYIDLSEIEQSLAYMTEHNLDRTYYSRIGVLTESDLLECRNAVLRAQERHLQAEGYQDERGRG